MVAGISSRGEGLVSAPVGVGLSVCCEGEWFGWDAAGGGGHD